MHSLTLRQVSPWSWLARPAVAAAAAAAADLHDSNMLKASNIAAGTLCLLGCELWGWHRTVHCSVLSGLLLLH